MRPFPEKTGSPSVPVSEAPATPKGLDWARAVVFGGDLAGEAWYWSSDGKPRPGGKARGTVALAATAAGYCGMREKGTP